MSTPTPPPGQEPHQQPGPPPPPPQYGGYGQPEQPQQPQQPPPAYNPQYGQQPYGQGQPPPYGQQPYQSPSPYPTKRPGLVTAASVITIVMSLLTGAVWIIFGALALAASDSELVDLYNSSEIQEGMGDANISLQDFQNSVTGFGIAFLVIGIIMLIAVLPAIGVLRGGGASRIILVVFSALTVLVGLFFTVAGSGTGIPWVLAGGLVIAFLFMGDSGSWFAGKKAGAV